MSVRHLMLLLVLCLAPATSPSEASAEYQTWTAHGMDWHDGCNNSGKMCIMTFRYAHHQEPKSLVEKIGECTNSETCKAAMIALVMAASGASKESATAAVNAVGYVLASVKQEGESIDSRIRVPDGYVLCTFRWKLWSGTSKTKLAIGTREWGMVVQSWAKKEQPLGPGHWVKANIEMRAARKDAVKDLRKNGRCLNSGDYKKAVIVWEEGAGDERGNAIDAKLIPIN